MKFDDGMPPNCSPESQNRDPEAKKSSSDRSGDSKEQPKSPEDTKFRIFLQIFRNFWKKLRPQSSPRAPKSAQEHPKSAPRAAQERPGVPQESPWRLPEAPKSAQVGSSRRPRGPKLLSEGAGTTSCSATRSRSAFGAIFGRFSKHSRKRRTSISKRPYGTFGGSSRIVSSSSESVSVQKKATKNC